MKEAIRQTRSGVILDLDISTGAKETRVCGYEQWRKRIVIKLSERAEKGKANAELVSFLSGLFGVDTSNIRITSGLTSGKKSVKIMGVKAIDILKVLNKNERHHP